MWNVPFAGRNRVWCQRLLAAEFAALARSRCCGRDTYVLVSCSIDGMIFYPRSRLSKTGVLTHRLALAHAGRLGKATANQMMPPITRASTATNIARFCGLNTHQSAATLISMMTAAKATPPGRFHQLRWIFIQKSRLQPNSQGRRKGSLLFDWRNQALTRFEPQSGF